MAQRGQIQPKVPALVEEPALPILLRGFLTLNLPYDEAVDKYGLWEVTMLERCWVWGTLLEPGDDAELTGDVVQQLVRQRKAIVKDKRMREEAEVVNRAAALGLPQKIREIAAFAPRKRDKFDVRLRDDAPAD